MANPNKTVILVHPGSLHVAAQEAGFNDWDAMAQELESVPPKNRYLVIGGLIPHEEYPKPNYLARLASIQNKPIKGEPTEEDLFEAALKIFVKLKPKARQEPILVTGAWADPSSGCASTLAKHLHRLGASQVELDPNSPIHPDSEEENPTGHNNPAFLAAMERELDQNAHKGNWNLWIPDSQESIDELDHHRNKLAQALLDNTPHKITEFCADIANITSKISETHGTTPKTPTTRALQQNPPQQFLGVCQPLRKKPGGEALWQSMMNQRTEISNEAFLLLVSPKEFLQRWGSLLQEANAQDPNAKTYLSLWGNTFCVFYQNNGWEYIWKLTP